MLEDDTAVMLFEDQTEGEERVINAVQKPLPPLVTNLRTATQEQLANRDVVLRSVENDVWQFQDAPEQFRADKEIADVALQKFQSFIEYVAGPLRSDRELLLASLRDGDRSALRVMSSHMIEDPDILEAALRTTSSTIPLLEYIPNRFRADEKVVLNAITKNEREWPFVDRELRCSPTFALRAIAKNGRILECSAPELHAFLSDREVVKSAIKSAKYGSVLQYASVDLQNDRALVKLQVQECARYLADALPRWQHDAEIVEIAIKGCTDMLRFADRKLFDDRSFVERQLKRNQFIYWNEVVVSPIFIRDRGLVLWALNEFKNGIHYSIFNGTPLWWRRDAEIVRAVLALRGTDLEYVASEFRSDRHRDIVQIAVKQDGMALQFANENLRDDRDLVLEAVQRTGNALQFASARLRADYVVRINMLCTVCVWERNSCAECLCLGGWL